MKRTAPNNILAFIYLISAIIGGLLFAAHTFYVLSQDMGGPLGALFVMVVMPILGMGAGVVCCAVVHLIVGISIRLRSRSH
jgi:hypothetical protein